MCKTLRFRETFHIKRIMIAAKVKSMTAGTSSAHDGLSTEHVKHAGHSIRKLLEILLTHIV